MPVHYRVHSFKRCCLNAVCSTRPFFGQVCSFLVRFGTILEVPDIDLVSGSPSLWVLSAGDFALVYTSTWYISMVFSRKSWRLRFKTVLRTHLISGVFTFDCSRYHHISHHSLRPDWSVNWLLLPCLFGVIQNIGRSAKMEASTGHHSKALYSTSI